MSCSASFSCRIPSSTALFSERLHSPHNLRHTTRSFTDCSHGVSFSAGRSFSSTSFSVGDTLAHQMPGINRFLTRFAYSA